MNVGLLLVLIGGLILTIGDIVFKKWAITNNWQTFFFGLFIWTIGLCFLAFSFKYKNIAIASLIFSLSNVIILTTISWFYFGETITIIQLVGIILGITAVILLES
jgi:multidrug transporter EmrE-like cation transporter